MRAAAALLGTALILTACNHRGGGEEAGPAARRDFQVAGAYDRVVLTGSPDVVVTVGGVASVRAEGDEATLDRLEIVNENGQLKIGLRSNSGGNWFSWGSHRGATVRVTLPALAGASVTGSGEMRIDRVEAPRFAGSVTGSGEILIAALAVGEADFTVTGSGEIAAAGTAQRARGSVTGSGDLHLDRLEVADATLTVAGSGDIAIRATATAAIEIRGSGDVTVTGPARCTISKSGSGDARCGG